MCEFPCDFSTDGKYISLEGIQKALLNGKVDGILVDAYVADSRGDLFGHPKLLLNKVIDLSSSYGVIMGRDGKKLQKCFVAFWKENAATRTQFIKENTSPVRVSCNISCFLFPFLQDS